MTLAVFDLCDTLVAENTTVGFLRAVAEEQPVVARSLKRWLGNPVFFVVGAVAQRLGRDLARERLVASLAGIDCGQIERMAANYADSLLADRGNMVVVDYLTEHRDKGDRIVILSSSLAPVVEAIAARLGVEGHGSALGITPEGRCTGKIVNDLTGAKTMIARRLRQNGEPMVVYSDNHTDEALLRQADQAFVILPAGRKRAHWAGDDVSYIAL